MEIMYHATSMENLGSILEKGLLPRGKECIYLAETEEDALKFVALRGYSSIVTFKVKIHKKDYDKLEETFDHNVAFFKCKSYGFIGNIPPKDVIPLKKYCI